MSKDELKKWLSRSVDEDIQDAVSLLGRLDVDAKVYLLREGYQRKAQAYSDVFPEGVTRKVWTLPAFVTVPKESTLGDTLYDVQRRLLAAHREDAQHLRDAYALAHNALCTDYHKFAVHYEPYYDRYPEAGTNPPPLAETWRVPTMAEVVHNRYADGSKVLRYLISLIPAEQAKLRTYFEMVVSEAVSKFKMREAFLVWSINPLDLLLISEAGISSCHSVAGDRGSYSGGTISYMSDTRTSVFYVTRDLRRFEDLRMTVPEKSFRSLCFYQRGEGYSIQRMYPRESARILEAIKEHVAESLPDSEYPIEGAPSCSVHDVAYHDPSLYGRRTGGYPCVMGVADGICPVCGDYMNIADGLCCSSCDGSVTCADCGEPIDVNDAYEVDGDYYCYSCYTEHFTTCYRCGEIVSRDDVTEVDGYDWCEYCVEKYAVQCDECGEYTAEDNAQHPLDEDGNEDESRVLCYSCWSDEHTTCDVCGKTIRKDDAHMIPGPYKWSFKRLVCDTCFVPAKQKALVEALTAAGGAPKG